jgi:hypothetical protein
MKIEEILKSLIVEEPNSNLGYLTTNFENALKIIANERDINLYNLDKHQKARFPFIGEFFENIFIENDEVLKNELFQKEVSRTIQKNRVLILKTDFELNEIEEIFDKLNFSDFSRFDDEKIIVAKRWFKW